MSDRKPYKSDPSDERWALIEPVITSWKVQHPSVSGHEGRYETREIVNALLYQSRTRCQGPISRPQPGGARHPEPQAGTRRGRAWPGDRRGRAGGLRLHAELEEALAERYGLPDVVVVEVEGAGLEVIPALAAATATYLDATLKGGDVIGVSSWSATLLESVKVMRAQTPSTAQEVVQTVGGSGSPEVQLHATRLTSRLAELTGARPVFAPSAALVGSRALRDLLSRKTGDGGGHAGAVPRHPGRPRYRSD
ncbi:sugar-binding domain-containing protein [Streptomyces sp. NPDC007851]|uniref:sugar-binding domain-containing protein n=1 Tax=Streptomyces sp. NPDC007851 TaxID=3155008 RepID=UPI0033EAE60D